MADPVQNISAKTIESVSGLIERVTFFSEESGFAVLKVKTKGRRDLVTVIGSLPSVTAGEWVTAEGFWVHNKEHGLSFAPKNFALSRRPRAKESRDISAAAW